MTILTRFLSSLALAVALATPQAVSAQTYPTKPIQVVVPAGPGSATDTVTRLILKKMEEQGSFSRPFVVVNTVGPLAATRVKDAAADGHELLVYHLGLDHLSLTLSENILLSKSVLHWRKLADSSLRILFRSRELAKVSSMSAEYGEVDPVCFGEMSL